MNKLIKNIMLTGVITTSTVYGYGGNNVIEVYNDCAVPCCSPYNQFSGLYFAANIGYSWFKFNLHRPAEFGLVPLAEGQQEVHDWSFVPAIGFDFYAQARIPLRAEVSYLYSDNKFSLDPLFPEDIAPGFNADDNFRIHNLMATLYVDWHNCSRMIPYVGVSYGFVNKKTRHFFNNDEEFDNLIFSECDHDSAWGGTLGMRFMLSCHFYGNLQYRFSELKSVRFKNTAPQEIPLPGQIDYLSDYLHEHSILFGISYQV